MARKSELELVSPEIDAPGSKEPISYFSGIFQNRYGLELYDNPVRDQELATELIQMRNWCGDVRHCIRIAKRDTFASSDGDEGSWRISKYLDPEETVKINPEVFAILNDLRERRQSHEEYVIGGSKMEKSLDLALSYGDCFMSLGIENEGISRGRRDLGIKKVMYLPTWEMFRQEDPQGNLLGFEQRKTVYQREADYSFLPYQIIHLRHDTNYRYGESLFFQSLPAWRDLQELERAFVKAVIDSGNNPTVHIFSEKVKEPERKSYKAEHEAKRRNGQIGDYYLLPGMDLKKLFNQNPDLRPFVEPIQQTRYRIIPPGIPIYYFPGLFAAGAREISEQPAKEYARMVYSWRRLVARGIRQICDTELILKKGIEWWRENGKYRIVFPKWVATGIENEEEEEEKEDLEEQEEEEENER